MILSPHFRRPRAHFFRGQNWQDGPEEISVYALLGHNKASLSWACPLLLGTSSKNQLADYLLSAVCTWQTLANGRPEGPGLSTNRRRRCSSHTQQNVSDRSSLAPRSLAPRMGCLVRRVRGWKNSVRDGLSPQSRAGVTQVRSYIGNSWHPAWSTLLLRNLSCNSVHCVLLHRLTRLPEKEPYCKYCISWADMGAILNIQETKPSKFTQFRKLIKGSKQIKIGVRPSKSMCFRIPEIFKRSNEWWELINQH